MKKLALLLAFVASTTGRLTAHDGIMWADFKRTFGREYGDRDAYHFQCFQRNLDTIEKLNAMDTATYGVNKFADLCAEDFKAYHSLNITMGGKEVGAMFAADVAAKAAADSVDWRTKGAVTAVKNQAQCGSCWAFSATGNMEGQWFLSQGKLVSLSEEEIVQCSKNGGNAGCGGGLMDAAFDWVASNGGIDSEADYPYTSGSGVTGTCKTAKLKNVVAKFSGHIDVPTDEAQMAAWVAAHGPLSVAVDAGLGWQLYMGGIKKSCATGQLDHGVLIVGYGAGADGTPYWIIKNSWASTWGERGYIRLERGVKCNGVNQAPSSAKL